MSTTEPICNKQDLKKFMDYYLLVCPNPRNYALILFGLYTALRISDILRLKWNMIYDFERKTFLEHIYIEEKKTKKMSVIALNKHLKTALKIYLRTQKPQSGDYVFTKRTTPSQPISRSQAFRIIKKTAGSAAHSQNISCHSLRKTFGYHAWKQGTPPAMLMDIYNHSSYSVTKRYLGINQDERDSVFADFDFQLTLGTKKKLKKIQKNL